MAKVRLVTVLGVVVIALLGAAATAYTVMREAPDALTSVLAVQAGVVVAMAAAAWALMSSTVARVDELIEALRAFARGDRHKRVNAADFAGLIDIARAVNEVGAALCENDDPNLGQVQRKPREKPIKKPGSDAPRPSEKSGGVKKALAVEGVGEVRTSAAPNVSEVGEARPATKSPEQKPEKPIEEKLEKSEKPDATNETTPPTVPPTPIIESEGVSEPRLSRKARKKAKKNLSHNDGAPVEEASEPTPEPTQEPTPEEVAQPAIEIDEKAEPTVENATVIESQPPVELPTREELRALFDEFRKEKRAASQDDTADLDFDAFAETITSESERLIAEHQCRGVRFEVAVAEGEVSLRPRLIR